LVIWFPPEMGIVVLGSHCISCPFSLDRVVIESSLGAGALEAALLGATPCSCPTEAGFPFEGECVVGSGEPAAGACMVGLEDSAACALRALAWDSESLYRESTGRPCGSSGMSAVYIPVSSSPWSSFSESLAIDIPCNNPFGSEWRVISLPCNRPYHPGILFEEIQSWLRSEFGRELNPGDLQYWHAWDEDGRVQLGDERNPKDGERYAILLQANGNQEDIELKWHPGYSNSNIQRFIRETRWRRIRSQYELDFERYARLSGAATRPAGARPSKCIVIIGWTSRNQR
jgi:hypothetical protein